MRLTVGPLPPAVYWRRRVLVLGAALMAVFLIAQACMASASTGDRAGGGPSPSGSTSPRVTTSATATAAARPTAPPPPPSPAGTPDGEADGDGGEEPDSNRGDLGPEGCTDREIRVIAESSETEFPVGQQVQLTIRIEHAAGRACRRDVGGDQRELYLVRDAGAGPVWSSQDCAKPTGFEVVELTDGWDRAHHIGFAGRETSRCSGRAAAGPELAPGTYQLWARLGTARSEPVPITLT